MSRVHQMPDPYLVAFKVEFTNGCSCIGCWKNVLKVVKKFDGVHKMYKPDRENGKLVLDVAVDPYKLIAKLEKINKVKTIELCNQEDSTNSQAELDSKSGGKSKNTVGQLEEEFDARDCEEKIGDNKRGGGLLGWLSRSISKKVMGSNTNANKIKPVLSGSRTERWGGCNNGVVICDDDENEGEHGREHEINRALLRRSRRERWSGDQLLSRSRSERRGDGNDRDVRRMRHVGRMGKTEQREQTERMDKMWQELEECDEEPEVSLVHRSRTKRQGDNDGSVIGDDWKKGKRDGEREISQGLSRSRTKRRGSDDGVSTGDYRNKGKHVEEHGVNQVLSRSRNKRLGGNNNCTVIDDDGNNRKHEIDLINHRKDNNISNDKREGKKGKGGGSGRHIPQMTAQTGQTEQTWQTAAGQREWTEQTERMEQMDSMWQAFEEQDQRSSNWNYMYQQYRPKY